MEKQYKKAVTFSYDDGVVFDERLITIFNKYGLKATFNMNGINENQETGWVTQRGLLVKRYDLQRENNVRIYDGHEIAVHTRHHYWLNQIDENTLEEEIVGNREDLERVFGREVNGMAYPFNTYDDRSVDILRKNGFLYAREGRETHSFALQEDLLRFACGLSEEEAVCTNKELDVRPGDTVLFKRGTLIRDRLWNVSGEEGAPVTYGAYGEGKPPVFCGSVDVSDPKDWAEIRKNVWKCLRFLDTEACNFVFNDEECGALKWEEAELSENGDWWDSGFCNDGESADKAHVTLLYCEKNPGIFYRHIECVLHKNRALASTGHDMVIQDLDFCNNGVHGIAGEEGGRNLLIKNCGFYRIGGCVWSKQQKIRFGNGIECWDIAENVIVEKLYL